MTEEGHSLGLQTPRPDIHQVQGLAKIDPCLLPGKIRTPGTPEEITLRRKIMTDEETVGPQVTTAPGFPLLGLLIPTPMQRVQTPCQGSTAKYRATHFTVIPARGIQRRQKEPLYTT